MKAALITIFLGLGVSLSPVHADEASNFLKLVPLPDGIVFEIIEADEGKLAELLPRVKQIIATVRQQAPEVEFAVVSHGREEFALQTSKQGQYSQIHDNVIALVADDVPVYVCETQAGWYGVTAEDFPEYVNVAPTGPSQISLYEELGFYLIVIE